MKSSLRHLNPAFWKSSKGLIPLIALAILSIVGILFWNRGEKSQSPAVGSSVQETPTPRRSQPRSAPSSAGRDGTVRDGKQLILAAIDQVTRGPSIVARLQQRVKLDDGEVLAVGAYRQEALKSGGRFNLQVRTKSGGLQVVSDGSFIWRQASIGESSRVTRIDLQQYARLTATDNRTGRTDWPSLPRQVSPLELGGIPQLLKRIAREFRFNGARPTVLADVPVYELEGVLASGGSRSESSPPGQIPSHVTLSLGQDDLFPYRILFECRRASTIEQERGVPRQVQIHFSEVSFGAAVDNRWFEYSPRDVAWDDVTAELASRAGASS